MSERAVEAQAAPVCAVIVSGGTGSRFGNPGGKQLVDIDGKPMMTWSIEAFDRSDLVGHIVVVCSEERREEVFARAIAPYDIKTPLTFAASGATRQDSTRSGLAHVPEGFTHVAVHDGARPLITVESIERVVRCVLDSPELDGAIYGQPAIDTLKRVDARNRIVSTPPRSEFWTVQTPQVFSLEVLRRACEQAEREGFLGTDEASLVERAGGAVACVECPRDNLKVTVPEDLSLVVAAMRRRHA